MQKSLYEQLKNIDEDMSRMTPNIWYDSWPDQNHGIVYGAILINGKKLDSKTDSLPVTDTKEE